MNTLQCIAKYPILSAECKSVHMLAIYGYCMVREVSDRENTDFIDIYDITFSLSQAANSSRIN